MWAFNNVLSNIILILLLTLGNNCCFVTVAKVRKWRLERKKEDQKIREKVTALMQECQRTQEEAAGSKKAYDLVLAELEHMKEKSERFCQNYSKRGEN